MIFINSKIKNLLVEMYIAHKTQIHHFVKTGHLGIANFVLSLHTSLLLALKRN